MYFRHANVGDGLVDGLQRLGVSVQAGQWTLSVKAGNSSCKLDWLGVGSVYEHAIQHAVDQPRRSSISTGYVRYR